MHSDFGRDCKSFAHITVNSCHAGDCDTNIRFLIACHHYSRSMRGHPTSPSLPLQTHPDLGGLVQQPLEKCAAAPDRQQGGHPEGEQLSIEREKALRLRAENRLATLLGKMGRGGGGTDYARMSMDQPPLEWLTLTRQVLLAPPSAKEPSVSKSATQSGRLLGSAST